AEIDLAHTATAEGFDQAVDAHNLAAQIGDARFVGFGFITSVARMRIMVGFVEARPSAPVIGARDGSEVGQQFEWIEQWAFYLVHAGFGGCPVDRLAVEDRPGEIVNPLVARLHASSPLPAGPVPVEPPCAPHLASVCPAPLPVPRRCSPSRPAQ